MASALGMIVNNVLVHGLLLFERIVPMPARLGAPLPLGTRARHDPDPVILVGGFANSQSGWDEWVRSLRADGFDVHVFDPPTVGLGDMKDSARAVAAFIEDVRRRTGRRRVDVIGFSEGGVLARMAVARFGSLGTVDRLISLATPHHGVPARGLLEALAGISLIRRALPEAAVQLITGSELLQTIARDDASLRLGRDPRAPRYASVFSRTLDYVVTPQSAWLPGALNLPVEGDRGGAGPNHFEMFHTSDRAFEAARALLIDAPAINAVRAGLRSLTR